MDYVVGLYTDVSYRDEDNVSREILGDIFQGHLASGQLGALSYSHKKRKYLIYQKFRIEVHLNLKICMLRI